MFLFLMSFLCVFVPNLLVFHFLVYNLLVFHFLCVTFVAFLFLISVPHGLFRICANHFRIFINEFNLHGFLYGHKKKKCVFGHLMLYLCIRSSSNDSCICVHVYLCIRSSSNGSFQYMWFPFKFNILSQTRYWHFFDFLIVISLISSMQRVIFVETKFIYFRST